ncbi:MAG TPA: YfhO family protein [Candidatus Binatia bacterium]|nr:YfhO family protein [Candidatus Binatia bacterium]
MLPNRYSWTREGLSLLFLTTLVFWFGGEMIWDGKVPFFRDLGPYFYPMRFSLAESLKIGELPLWDRQVAAGFPLLADFQSGAFYPPHVVFLLVSFFSAVATMFLFHYLVAATGCYFLCRHWGYPFYLSIIGAILFTFGGVIVSLTNLLNHFQTAVWLPWVVLLAERCLRSLSWRRFVAFVCVLLVQLLAGSPEFYVMSMALVLLASVRAKLSGAAVASYSRILLLLLGGNLLAASLAMVQLAPTVELFLHSRRSQVIPYSEAMDWSLNPANLLNLVFLNKEVDTSILAGMSFFFPGRASLFLSYYLGAISLFGAWFWALYSSAKERAITLLLIALTLIFAFGGYTPFYPWVLRYAPVFALIRFPEKYFFLTYGLLWFVILRGLVAFMGRDVSKPSRTSVVVFPVILMLVPALLLLTLNTEYVSQWVASKANSVSPSYQTIKVAASVLLAVERQVFLSIGILILILAAKKRLARTALFQVLLVTVVFIDFDRAHRDYQYLLSPDLVNQGPRVISRPESDLARVFYYPGRETLHPAQYSVLARPSFEGAISLVYNNLLPNTGVFHGFHYFQEIDAFSRRPYLAFLNFTDRADPELRFRLLRALNINYVISFRPLPELGITLIRHFPEYPSWLYRLDGTVPRTYVVSKSIVESNPTQVLRRLASPEFDRMQEVVLDQEPGIRPQRPLLATTNIVRYGNRAVTIHASLNDSGILILADSYYPGWKAYVDGQEASILKANYFFRGVALPAGDHTVEFRYDPLSFKIGWVISLLSLTAVGLVTLWRYLSRREKAGVTALA